MKYWAIIVAGLYVMVLAVLTVPVAMLAFAPELDPVDASDCFLHWPYWAWLGVMGVCQFALLSVPVRVVSRRPLTRGALWPTILAGGLMVGALVAGAYYSILEFVIRDESVGTSLEWAGIVAGIASWGVWALVFRRVGDTGNPGDFVTRQCRLLFKGSILELLIAIPTHIVARYRDYCCAGFMTFVGLTMGTAVMLFAFGPAVFYLFVARWKRLHPPPDGK